VINKNKTSLTTRNSRSSFPFRIVVILLSLGFIFAIKPYYGGEVTIRLNEPLELSFNPSSYSNQVFYGLMYENFFYLRPDGEIYSHIFKSFEYNSQTHTLQLTLQNHLCFSNGRPVSPKNIEISLKLFMDLNLVSSRKLGGILKNIAIPQGRNEVWLELGYDVPDVVRILTAPELVLVSSIDEVFSGPYYPVEWVRNQYIILKSNPFYPGGRSYLDSIKVVFYDFFYPDIFLSDPGMTDDRFKEVNAGIYQNIYLAFPQQKIGENTRFALYSMLKYFYKNQNMVELKSLTSNEESPITLDIKTFSYRRIRSILRYSQVNLFVLSSLQKIEAPLNEFIRNSGARIDTTFISDKELTNFISNNSVKYLLLAKTFNQSMPMAEKIKVILKELSFGRFNETYLKMLNQLDEVQNLNNDEMLTEQVAMIIEKVINEGFLLPLYQKHYSLYIKKEIKGLELDYYGIPLFQRVQIH